MHLGQVPNQSIPNLLGFPNPSGVVLHHCLIQSQGDLQHDWRKESRIDCVREFVRDRIMDFLQQQPKVNEWGSKIYAAHLENQLFIQATSKEEYMNQETLNYRVQILIRHGWCDANYINPVDHRLSFTLSDISIMNPSLGISNSSCSTNSPDPPVDHSMTTCTYNNYQSDGFLLGPLHDGYDQGLASFACGGNNMLSPMSRFQLSSQASHHQLKPCFSGQVDLMSPSMCQNMSPSYGFLNEAVNVGSAFIGSNVPYVDGAAAESESCLNLSTCVNHESQQQHLDPHIQYQLIPGHEVNALRSLDVGNNLTMNHPDLQPSLKKSPSWLLLSSLQISQQLPQIMHENFDFLPKMNDQTPNLSPEILLQSQQLMQKVQQFQQRPHEPYVQLDQPYEVHFCDLGGQAHGRLDNDEALQLKVPGQYQLSESHTIHQQFMDQESSISEPLVQNDSHLQIAGEDIYQQPPLPSEESIGVQDITSERSAVLCGSNGAALSWNITGDSEYYKVHRFLLLYIQYMHNSISEENCKDFEKMGQFLKHHLKWNGDQCKCFIYHRMLWHYQNCYYVDCPMCGPVRRFDVSCPFDLGLRRSKNGSQMTANDGDDGSPIRDATEDIEPPMKRLKMEHSYLPSLSKNIESQVLAPSIDQPQATQVLMQMHQGLDAGISVTSEVADVDLTNISEIRDGDPADSHKVMPNCDPVSSTEFSISSTQADIQAQSKFDQVKQETEHENFAPAANHISGTKLGNLKIKAVSLIELFTPEQIKEHIRSLRQWVGQSKANAEKNHAMEYPMNENSCQLCMMEKLSFEIPPIYCSLCGACIKRNMTYYTALDGIMRYCFCASCYSESRAQSITVDGLNVHKATLLKKKNDEENDESWVQCDKCQGWQHQICALYNAKRDEGGNAEYICPYCYLKEIESGEHIPLADRNLLGAKDLPRTKLSDHIEDRLFNHLKQEREERAKIMGKNFDEVPGAEALFVRVVLSVNKILEVKQHFRETFQEEKYPEEFPYRSKVILLFQKIEGVEVCLFGMCVQEFGSECSYPNQRCVYLSYLDSVKYFRPNIKTVTGEALRTFVYHEILIGYLDYCKKRGFSSCHIWACPPLRGDDYILYCHPEIQKMPKSDKLREWYLAILKKAAKENIVVNVTNLYDHFFVPAGECKAKITATRLPYFDGDYWPGAAEDMINYFNQKVGEEKLQRKGKNSVSRRTLKAMRRSDISGNAAKDILLMKKLGETIYPMKEDFLMVSLQFVCTHCSEVIASGRRWVCNICKKFQLCEKCHDAEQNLDEKNKHPIKSRKKHVLAQVEVIDVPLDTEDREEILDNELFENQNTFLSFCQGKHYQFDTLRRAKHSSMMILYYLHNPTAAAVFATCNICHNDIEVGEDWHCMVCPEFRVCDACYHQKECGGVHIHKLTRHSSMVNHKGQSKMTQTKSTSQIRQLLDVLVHASHCCQGPVNPCPYQLCSTFKKFFCHTKICKTRMARGCKHCKKIWFLLQLHSRNCIQLECPVPRCMDLKKLAKNRELQSDTRRRDGVTKLVKTAGS